MEQKKKQNICQICGVVFKKASIFEDHLKGHLRSLPFACDLCGFSVDSQALLQEHQGKVHPLQYPDFYAQNRLKSQLEVDCLWCSTQLLGWRGMSKHIRDVHPQECAKLMTMSGYTHAQTSLFYQHLLRELREAKLSGNPVTAQRPADLMRNPNQGATVPIPKRSMLSVLTENDDSAKQESYNNWKVGRTDKLTHSNHRVEGRAAPKVGQSHAIDSCQPSTSGAQIFVTTHQTNPDSHVIIDLEKSRTDEALGRNEDEFYWIDRKGSSNDEKPCDTSSPQHADGDVQTVVDEKNQCYETEKRLAGDVGSQQATNPAESPQASQQSAVCMGALPKALFSRAIKSIEAQKLSDDHGRRKAVAEPPDALLTGANCTMQKTETLRPGQARVTPPTAANLVSLEGRRKCQYEFQRFPQTGDKRPARGTTTAQATSPPLLVTPYSSEAEKLNVDDSHRRQPVQSSPPRQHSDHGRTATEDDGPSFPVAVQSAEGTRSISDAGSPPVGLPAEADVDFGLATEGLTQEECLTKILDLEEQLAQGYRSLQALRSQDLAALEGQPAESDRASDALLLGAQIRLKREEIKHLTDRRAALSDKLTALKGQKIWLEADQWARFQHQVPVRHPTVVKGADLTSTPTGTAAVVDELEHGTERNSENKLHNVVQELDRLAEEDEQLARLIKAAEEMAVRFEWRLAHSQHETSRLSQLIGEQRRRTYDVAALKLALFKQSVADSFDKLRAEERANDDWLRKRTTAERRKEPVTLP